MNVVVGLFRYGEQSRQTSVEMLGARHVLDLLEA